MDNKEFKKSQVVNTAFFKARKETVQYEQKISSKEE